MVRLIALTLSLSLLLGCLESSELTAVEAGQELVVVTRNTPTTYFFDGDRASGFDYSLVKRFAQQHGMTLRIKVAFSLPELFDMLERGDRAPNFFLPDQRDIVINLNDKARGGPLFVLLYPT